MTRGVISSTINAARFRPEPPLPNPAERSPMGLPPTPVSTGGGGRPRGRRRGTPGDFRFTNQRQSSNCTALVRSEPAFEDWH
jgi:hypothetical protein